MTGIKSMTWAPYPVVAEDPSKAVAARQSICICPDGRVKALYSDNSIILLNSWGTAFIYVGPQGNKVRQICEYALRDYRTQLIDVLSFRNLHLETPAYCKPLIRTLLKQSFRLGYPISSVVWPATAADAQASGLVERLRSAEIAVRSECSAAVVVVDRHFRRLAVCYPALLKLDRLSNEHTYVWQTQVFPLRACPSRWLPARRTALLCCCALYDIQPPSNLQHMLASGESNKVLARASTLPIPTVSAVHGTCSDFLYPSWWYDPVPDLPSAEPLSILWGEDATYAYDPDLEEAEAWLSADGSCLWTTMKGRFICHARLEQDKPLTHAEYTIPDFVWSVEGRLFIGRCASTLLKFRSAIAAVHARRRRTGVVQAPLDNATVLLSDVVQEQHSAAGHGTFSYFTDGRVKVMFEDRTLLEMDARRDMCRLILPDGSRASVRVACPVGVEGYVRAALEFGVWAARSPAQRSAEVVERARVAAEAQACQRSATLLGWRVAQPPPHITASTHAASGRAGLHTRDGMPGRRAALKEGAVVPTTTTTVAAGGLGVWPPAPAGAASLGPSAHSLPAWNALKFEGRPQQPAREANAGGSPAGLAHASPFPSRRLVFDTPLPASTHAVDPPVADGDDVPLMADAIAPNTAAEDVRHEGCSEMLRGFTTDVANGDEASKANSTDYSPFTEVEGSRLEHGCSALVSLAERERRVLNVLEANKHVLQQLAGMGIGGEASRRGDVNRKAN